MPRPPAAVRTADSMGEPTDAGDAVCPICGLATGSDDRTYAHLQMGHRKSELAGLVVDW